jgi:predicted small lipoprotein YifL
MQNSFALLRASLVLVVFLLSGCGQKGPLTLPDQSGKVRESDVRVTLGIHTIQPYIYAEKNR